jgi:NADPH:quinone reductase
MRAVVVRRLGGPDALKLVEVPAPTPAEGELLVDVAVAGVNYRDIYERTGSVGEPTPPFIPGIEGAGTVSELGPGVTGLAVGDRVAWMHVPGSYAERVAMPVASAVPVPPGLPLERAAAVLLQGVTAHYLCSTTYAVGPGDTVVVHAGAGGTGLLLTQMIKLRGGRVIATTSSEEKAALARAVGADEVVVGYRGFERRVLELTDGVGVAAVYDGVGRETAEAGLACLTTRGVLVCFGEASGPVPPIATELLARGSLYVTRPRSRDHVRTRDELLLRAGEVFGWALEGRLDVRVGGRYTLSEAARAQADLASRKTTGKLLLLVG